MNCITFIVGTVLSFNVIVFKNAIFPGNILTLYSRLGQFVSKI